jgi:glycosyltransferase involved in cell wall biosynthesis
MKIAYDYQAFALTPYSGISRYLYEISKNIALEPDCEVKIVAPLYSNQYLKDSPSGMVIGQRYDNLQDLLGLTSLINRQRSTHWLKANPPDILHETYYDVHALAPSHCRTVLTIHDMIHEKFSKSMNASERNVTAVKKQAIKRADHLICVSENTKKDLLEIFDIEPDRVSVIYHGCSLLENETTAPTSPTIVTAPYLLYVGNRGYYKNFQALLQAYASNPSLATDFKLVCFGGGRFSLAEKSEIQRLKIKENQILYLAGSDRLLANLYRNAVAFIYPSLYEGFGIPPLEAMSLGCPVICSNVSSIPEVVGEAGRYFDPNNIEDMGNAIESVALSPETKENLIVRGLNRAAQFTWQKCAQETYSLYHNLISTN